VRFSQDRIEPGPSHWIIIDPRPPGYIAQAIVDRSPGAIERELERDWNRWPGDRPDHIRDLSFGVRLIYGIDFDAETDVLEGKPIRHLAVHGSNRPATPATVGEITAYFWGRRPAQMRIATSGLAHVVVGMDWEQLDPKHLMRLL
jgi:hypothetical protein